MKKISYMIYILRVFTRILPNTNEKPFVNNYNN